MSERMRRPGEPERPREGVYLDATLAVIGEQLEERIDELSRRRRIGARVGVAALSVFAVTSGSLAAAVALSAVPEADPASAALSAVHELRCVEGTDAGGDAYFTLRYLTAEGAPAADDARVCASAWSALEADEAALVAATPARLIQIAEGFVAAALPEAEMEAEGEAAASAAPVVEVTDASFGRRSNGGTMPPMIACDAGATSVVLAVPDGPDDLTVAERARACERAAS
ncbi:hypothetical protein ET445_15510 [Agromyces protaetiae]|uniref:Uncharacterized protein n=1 Tax=Agromyces protaetiae TaxID=2509455 RepID=A0A4P6FF16_9MICO|nr:hypothetical protein [Agromyces protaetiae]QAY74525.1 hypothetical protein ET445_15510 [Agromyces protaetiae]